VEAAVGTSPADIDEDGDVGLDYHALLWPCMESLGAEIEVQCVDADCTGDGIIDLSDWLMLQGALWEQHNPTTTPVARRLAGASENTRRGVPACVPSGLAPAAQWNRVIWRGASRRLGVCGRAAAPLRRFCERA
jgi:hypothetical protein